LAVGAAGSVRVLTVWKATKTNSAILFVVQADDGIRDKLVTGVQTCALPIYPLLARARAGDDLAGQLGGDRAVALRSGERRVGEECRSRWSPYQEKKKRL